MERNYKLTADVVKDHVDFFIIREGGDFIFETKDGESGELINLVTKERKKDFSLTDVVAYINNDNEIKGGSLEEDLRKAFSALTEYREMARNQKVSHAIAINVEKLIRR